MTQRKAVLSVAVLILALLALFFITQNKSESLQENLDSVSVTGDESVEVQSSNFKLPNTGIVPSGEVAHIIPINEIKRGCPRQDCIPSVENPEFSSIDEISNKLPQNTIGIALSYKGNNRFYPFPMLETHELVNDEVAGDPLLVSYCPLCGTGIVFSREVAGEVYEFGVSGMLWQSNLLMYNRSSDIENQNLWSQVLGQAVVGNLAGTELEIIPSDIIRFSDWTDNNPDGLVLDTGQARNPYSGNYYLYASSFGPDFDSANSPLAPMTYVHGIELDGFFKAYVSESIPVGETMDEIDGNKIRITKTDTGIVYFEVVTGEQEQEFAKLSNIEGFWFSWASAHPDTLLWN